MTPYSCCPFMSGWGTCLSVQRTKFLFKILWLGGWTTSWCFCPSFLSTWDLGKTLFLK